MTEQAHPFRIGGVYRNYGDEIVMLAKESGDGFAEARHINSDASRPACSNNLLSGGRSSMCIALGLEQDYAYNLIPGELVKREGQWVTAEAPATIGPFGSGASLKTDGSQITGRIEPEAGDYPVSWESLLNAKPGGLVQVRKPVPYPVCSDPFTYAAPAGNRLLTSEELLADLRKVLESVRAQDAIPEPKRAPLPHFNQRTPFDTFGPGFKVRSDTGWMTGEDGHPLQRMTADSPTHGSAHLLAKP